jgi:hypothetical protein
MPMYRVFPSLEPLFPAGYTLTGNDEARLLSLLARVPSEGEQGRLLAQEYLTPAEWRILMALIDAYPGSASYAHLLAVLTSSSQAAYQQRLHEARASDSVAVKHVLRPLRKVLASLHPKLKHVGLRAASVQGQGYVLVAFEEEESGEQVTPK